MPGLLAHVGLTLGSRRVEDLCSSSLVYLVESSPDAQGALWRLLSDRTGITLPELSLRTQKPLGDLGRPDIVGLDNAGNPRLIIEAKLNAGFGPGQIWDYSRILTDDNPGVVLVLAPEARLPSLWADAKQQLETQDVKLSGVDGYRAYFRGHALAAASWRSVLEAVEPHVASAELEQVRDLLAYFGQQAFLPLTSDDVSRQMGRILVRLDAIVQGVGRQLRGLGGDFHVRVGHLDGGSWGYGYLCDLEAQQVWIGVSYRDWAELADTPFWFTVKGIDKREAEGLKSRLRSALGDETVVFYRGADRNLQIGLNPRFGSELNGEVEHVAVQCMKILGCMDERGQEA